jgi:hypothetical protein
MQHHNHVVRIKSKTINMEMLLMDNFGEKRKNSDRRSFPWRSVLLLVIGFALGVIVTLLFTPSSSATITYMSSDDFARSEISVVQPAPDDFALTATYIIQQATEMARGVFVTPDSPQADTLYATATAIIQQATATQAAVFTAAAGS